MSTALVAGFIAGFSLQTAAPGYWMVLVPVALLFRISRNDSAPGAVMLGALFGIGLSIGSGAWVPEALRGLGASPAEARIGFVFAIAWASLPYGVALGLFAHFARTGFPLVNASAAAAGVFFLECTILNAQGGVPWTFLGYAAADSEGVRQLAGIAGVPFLSAALAFVAHALSEALGRHPTRRRLRLPLASIASVLVLALTGEAVARRMIEPATRSDAPSPMRFLFVQPDLPRVERLRPSLARLNQARLARFTRDALRRTETHPDVVVFPENTLRVASERDPASGLSQRKYTPPVDAVIIIGALREKKHVDEAQVLSETASVIVFDADGSISGRVDKFATVPVIEGTLDSPWSRLIAEQIGAAGRWPKAAQTKEVEVLDTDEAIIPALCFEALFPSIIERRRPELARVILNLADDSWIRGGAATQQLTRIARFRAIEQRLPLVRLAHGGLSVSFDAFGRQTRALPLDEWGSFELELELKRRRSKLRELWILLLPLSAGCATWALLSTTAPGWARRSPSVDDGFRVP